MKPVRQWCPSKRTAPGIPDEERDRFPGHGRAHPGSGIHIVRSLVERFGGGVDVITGREGTTVTATVPTHRTRSRRIRLGSGTVDFAGVEATDYHYCDDMGERHRFESTELKRT